MYRTGFPESMRWPAARVSRRHVAVRVLPRWKGKHLLCAGLLAALFLVVHALALAPAPDDVDAVNFALALQDFNPELHQPHPPGYPLFVAMGRMSRTLLAGLPGGASEERGQLEARALALCSAVLGAAAVFPLLQLFSVLEGSWRRAWAATAIAVTSPLFWFTSARPLSDVPGLAISLVVQALVVTALVWMYAPRGARLALEPAAREAAAVDRLLVIAAFTAGAAIGIRSQTVWLTLPLVLVAVACRVRRYPSRIAGRLALALIGGVALWAVPLMAATGGPDSYYRLLRLQAAEDFRGVDMLALDLAPRKLARALYHTLVLPWVDRRLAAVVLGAAAVGAAALLHRSRRTLVLLAVAVLPYGVFHLLFHETDHTRYALPLVPAVAYLAACGFAAIARRALLVPSLVVAGVSLYLSGAPLLEYATAGSPAFRAAADVRTAAAGLASPPVVAMHNGVWLALRGEELNAPVLPSKNGYEWLELARYWRQGGSAPVWFLARSRRTDLALIDPSSRRLVQRYQWTFRTDGILGGARPSRVDWLEIREPGWFAEAGWSLTPEVHGVSYRDRRGPAHAPIVAFVRRRQQPASMLLGGRTDEGSPVRVDVTVDGTAVASWTVEPATSFLEISQLPEDVFEGGDRYARLEVSAVPIGAGPAPNEVLIDQFDVQSDVPLVGFDEGWYELEAEPQTGRMWRWSGDTAKLRIENFGQDVTLRLRGDSPIEYFAQPPTVSVRAGNRILHSFSPTPGFDLAIPLSAETLRGVEGLLTIESDRTFVPDAIGRGPDRRRLALRLFDVRVDLAARPTP